MSNDDAGQWMRDSAGNWIRDIALLRIGEDTVHLAAAGHLDDPDVTCACEQCTRDRGRIQAEQEVTAQARREAAARAEVTRELDGYGAYPYRAGGKHPVPDRAGEIRRAPARQWAEETPCTCGQAPDSVNWEDHAFGGCQRRAALIEVRRHEAEQWWEVTRGAVLPDYGQRAAVIPDQPPGTCKDCRTGPLFAGNQCWYCSALGDLAIAKPDRHRHHFTGCDGNCIPDRRPPLAAVILAIAIAVLALYLVTGLLLAGAL